MSESENTSRWDKVAYVWLSTVLRRALLLLLLHLLLLWGITGPGLRMLLVVGGRLLGSVGLLVPVHVGLGDSTRRVIVIIILRWGNMRFGGRGVIDPVLFLDLYDKNTGTVSKSQRKGRNRLVLNPRDWSNTEFFLRFLCQRGIHLL
jgi:hypothetical protein